MENRLVHMFEGFLGAIFADLRPGYGSKTRDWERDYKRSLHELRVRGKRMLTIDLPAARKHFDKCLDVGLYTPSGCFLSKVVSERVKVPAFLRVLYLQVFDMSGKLRDEPCVNAIADIRQFYDVFAKLKDKCDDRYTREAVREFIKNDQDLRNPTLHWNSDDLSLDSINVGGLSLLDGHIDHHGDQLALELTGSGEGEIPRLTSYEIRTLHRVWDIIASQLGDFHDEAAYADSTGDVLPKHGPGRVSNLRKDQSKFTFSDWPSKLERTFPYDRYGVVNLRHTPILDDASRWPQNREHPSKLIAVPKTATGPRLIGSEPNYHVWVQQLVRFQLEAAVRKTVLRNCISFGDQGPNGQLALRGSRDGSIATVDLKSASDRLSAWTVERVLRRNVTLLERIHACRTRSMRNAVDGQFDTMVVKKCFTQGNALTFPVQTIIYSMIAIGCQVVTARPSLNSAIKSSVLARASSDVRVFGDDIVVPVGTLPLLSRVLAYLQLKVNPAKTFHTGKFRESCGIDAYDGVDVTPARIKQYSLSPSHEVIESLKQASNNFWLKGMWHVADWITNQLPRHMLPIVPPHDSDGLISFCGYSDDHLQKRYNRMLHRYEMRTLSLVSNSKQVPTQSAHDLFEFLHIGNPKETWLRTLYPMDRKIGVVHKQSSVMKTGWRPCRPATRSAS